MKKRWKSDFPLGRKLQKIFRCMKLTFLLLTCFVVQAFASLNAQTVTIKKQNASLEEVIWELKQQTRFTFMYNNEDIVHVKGIDLNEKEVDGIAAMAHKLLPLFTMIGAEDTIAPLKWLEACRGEEFSEKIEETTFNTLEAVRKIISEAEHYLEVMKNTQ